MAVHYKARLGTFMRAYTLFIFIGLAGAASFSFLRGDTIAGISLLAVFGFLLLTGLFSVRGYGIEGDQLVIERPAWNTYVDLSSLCEAKPVPNIVNRSYSLWSTRGLFGFIGHGYTSEIGDYRAYVTDSSNAVLLRFSTGKVLVVSPDRPAEFVSTLLTGQRLRSREQSF